MQFDVRRRKATWWSRIGNDWTDRLPDLGALAAELPQGVYDGEVCALNAAGEPDFSALRSFLGSRQTGRIVGDIVFFAFDLLTDRSGDLRPKPLRERKARLCAAIEPSGAGRFHRLRYVDALPGSGGPALFAAATAMGLEGIVSKRLDAAYTGRSKRLDMWLKAKSRPSQEVVVGGWETDGERFTALMVGVHEGVALRYVGHVGTGYPQATVTELLARLRPLQIDRSPFTGGPRSSSCLRWVRPELVAAVNIAEWTASGLRRQASFKACERISRLATWCGSVRRENRGGARGGVSCLLQLCACRCLSPASSGGSSPPRTPPAAQVAPAFHAYVAAPLTSRARLPLPLSAAETTVPAFTSASADEGVSASAADPHHPSSNSSASTWLA